MTATDALNYHNIYTPHVRQKEHCLKVGFPWYGMGGFNENLTVTQEFAAAEERSEAPQ